MIVFELTCAARHRFEGWFNSGDDFDRQSGRGLVSCPTCGTSKVTKVPTAKIKRGETQEPQAAAPVPARQAAAAGQPVAMPTPEQMAAFIDHVLQNSENVGKKFADEARKIHREEAPARPIRGQATKEEAESLWEEGIPVLPLPIPSSGEMH